MNHDAPLCPPHEKIRDSMEDFNGCLACLRNERDELRARMEDARRLAEWTGAQTWVTREVLQIIGRILAHPAPAPATCAWLIERGQAVNHAPTMWWCGPGRYDYTNDANLAEKFPTRAAAEAAMDRHYMSRPGGPVMQMAVEHVFLPHPAPDGPPPVPPWETRQNRAAQIVLGVGFFLVVLAMLTKGPLSVASGAGAAVWTVVGAWVTR